MAPYIETTLKSVLSQEYSNLEYIVIDGGSTDGTQEIIEKYRNNLAYYISEPDNGMYDAISKGFEKATGDIIAWINADDVYMPWTLQVVNEIFKKYPETQWIGGKYAFLNENGTLAQIFPKTSVRGQKDILNGWCRDGVLGPLQQESMFWRRGLYVKSGGLDTSYRFAGDFELWTRFSKFASLAKMDLPLAAFRKRGSSLSKAGREKYEAEIEKVIGRSPRYPNLLRKIFNKFDVGIQILRLLTYRKGIVFYYSMSQELEKRTVFCSSSNHSIQSLFVYRK